MCTVFRCITVALVTPLATDQAHFTGLEASLSGLTIYGCHLLAVYDCQLLLCLYVNLFDLMCTVVLLVISSHHLHKILSNHTCTQPQPLTLLLRVSA